MDGLIVKGADMGMGLEPDDDDGLIGLEYYEQEATTYPKQERKAVCPFVTRAGLDSVYHTLKSRSKSRIDIACIYHILLLTSFAGRLYGLRSRKQQALLACAKQLLSEQEA